MTRLLRPPLPIRVTCRDGEPTIVYRSGRRRVVTHIAATWVRPAAWWSDEAETDPLLGERTYYRVVTDKIAVIEVFSIDRDGRQDWYLSRIID